MREKEEGRKREGERERQRERERRDTRTDEGANNPNHEPRAKTRRDKLYDNRRREKRNRKTGQGCCRQRRGRDKLEQGHDGQFSNCKRIHLHG